VKLSFLVGGPEQRERSVSDGEHGAREEADDRGEECPEEALLAVPEWCSSSGGRSPSDSDTRSIV
jgi:hypothetical protein